MRALGGFYLKLKTFKNSHYLFKKIFPFSTPKYTLNKIVLCVYFLIKQINKKFLSKIIKNYLVSK